MRTKSILYLLVVSGICFFSCNKKGNDTPGGSYTKNNDSSYTITFKNDLNKRLVMKIYDRTEDYYAQKNARFSKIFEAGEALVFPDKLTNDSSYIDLYAEDFTSTNWLQGRPVYLYENTTIHIATMGDPRPRRVLVKMTDSVTNWVAFNSYTDSYFSTSNWSQLSANEKNKKLKIRVGRLNYMYADNVGQVKDSSWDFAPRINQNLYTDTSSFTFTSNNIAFTSNYSPSRRKYNGGDDTAIVRIDFKYYVMYRQ